MLGDGGCDQGAWGVGLTTIGSAKEFNGRVLIEAMTHLLNFDVVVLF
jgi:hypothetical protein